MQTLCQSPQVSDGTGSVALCIVVQRRGGYATDMRFTSGQASSRRCHTPALVGRVAWVKSLPFPTHEAVLSVSRGRGKSVGGCVLLPVPARILLPRNRLRLSLPPSIHSPLLCLPPSLPPCLLIALTLPSHSRPLTPNLPQAPFSPLTLSTYHSAPSLLSPALFNALFLA
jgi:hypothetical protein